MTDQEARKKLKKALEGHWEYECRVTSETPFENDERGNGGLMFINVSLIWTGVSAGIEAERLWATKDPHDDPAKRQTLENPILWRDEGGVIFGAGRFSFRYIAGDERGEMKDTFQLSTSDDTLFLSLGEFAHRRIDGQLVSGTVQLRKMNNANDFKWAPPNIKPAGVVVQTSRHSKPVKKRRRPAVAVNIDAAGPVVVGTVSGGEVSGTTTQIQLAAGDANALEVVLKAIQVPLEDVQEITKIVKDEKPKPGTLGTRAADWVGRMVTKGLTGAWEVGKDVSVAVLSEMLLRYYGYGGLVTGTVPLRSGHSDWSPRDDERYDVFLMYNRSDQAAVRRIADQLARRGINPWFDQWSLKPGTPWQKELERIIHEVEAAALFVGPSEVGPWQQMELSTLLRSMIEHNRPIIPVILPGRKAVPRLPLFLQSYTRIDFRVNTPDPLDELVWGITGKRMEPR